MKCDAGLNQSALTREEIIGKVVADHRSAGHAAHGTGVGAGINSVQHFSRARASELHRRVGAQGKGRQCHAKQNRESSQGLCHGGQKSSRKAGLQGSGQFSKVNAFSSVERNIRKKLERCEDDVTLERRYLPQRHGSAGRLTEKPLSPRWRMVWERSIRFACVPSPCQFLWEETRGLGPRGRCRPWSCWWDSSRWCIDCGFRGPPARRWG